MPLIEKKLVTERETVSYKLDCKTIELVRRYSEFIGSPQEHVVNQALQFIFRKDKDFKEWLAANYKELDLMSPEAEGKEPSRNAQATRTKA